MEVFTSKEGRMLDFPEAPEMAKTAMDLANKLTQQFPNQRLAIITAFSAGLLLLERADLQMTDEGFIQVKRSWPGEEALKMSADKLVSN